MRYYLGCDIGSVSIKLAVINEKGELIDKVYLKNYGLIDSIKDALTNLGDYDISGVGITGSGKEFVNILVGGDIIESEIIAHSTATLHYFPGAKTIFDIGGEDSKLVMVKDGIIHNFMMNRDCVLPTDEVIVDGFVPKQIKNVKVGDKVLTHNGRFKDVIKTINRGHNGIMYHIDCGGSNKLNVTENHPILILKRGQIKCFESKKRGVQICNEFNECDKRRNKKQRIDFEPKFITPDNINKGDFLVQTIPKNKITDNKFNPDFLRFCGYYLAEGNIEYNKSRKDKKVKYEAGVALCFNKAEKNYINDAIDILNNEGLSPKCKLCKGNRYIIRVYNSEFAKRIKSLCGEYSDKKRLNNELLKIDNRLLMNLVIGLFRGDAHFAITDRKRSLVLKTASKILASQIYCILLINNIKNTITHEIPKDKKKVYMINISGEEINKLNDYILIASKRRRNPMKCEYGYLIQVKSINKEHYVGDVYNLTVKEDNTYVCNNLAVHNCGGGTGAMIESIASRIGVRIEDVGDIALKSKNDISLPSKCGIFCQSAVVSKLNKGLSKEDILMGVCRGLISNYLNVLAKGKVLEPPFVFQGATAQNKALVFCLENELKHQVVIPKHCSYMGAVGMALLALEKNPFKTNFRGFEIANTDFNTKTKMANGCSNQCEITCIYKDDKKIGYIGNRCEKCVKKEELVVV